MIATPEVTLLAHTTINENVLDVDHMDVGGTRMGLDESAMGVDTLAEFAGRSCYQAWSKPNPATREHTTDTRYVHLPCPHCGWHP